MTLLLIVRVLLPLVLWLIVFAVPVRWPVTYWSASGLLWFATVSASSWFVGWGMNTAWQRLRQRRPVR